MNYTKMKELLDQCPQMWGTMDQGYQKWEEYVEARRELYSRLASENENANLTSELNWMLRSQYAGCHQLGIDVFPGDVCYMDFGQAYKYEIGYQHFGIVISICFGKALVVPQSVDKVAGDNQRLFRYNQIAEESAIPKISGSSAFFIVIQTCVHGIIRAGIAEECHLWS